MKLYCGILLAILAGTFSSAACSFGPQGHRTVGAIADRLLAPNARLAVKQLLKDDRDANDQPSHRTKLEQVSTWADEIRPTPASRPAWHFDNIPACGTAAKAVYCENDNCNTAQTARLLRVLADHTAPARERNEALKWVVHLIGDVHQPLHAADNHDRGGNEVRVALAGVKTQGSVNLHGAWDNELASLALGTRGHQRPPKNMDALAREAGVLLKSAGLGTPDSWAAESHGLATSLSYHYAEFSCDAVPTKIIVLSRAYQAQAKPALRNQLLLAGARLAKVLNDALQ